ncbi:N-acetylmuramic acid 6-phosphate etherase [Kocuria sp. WRN011]|uniref:N-acetylmuramic acid 6-phosphate etherase n=1 Tax=Kocuria sp. WRN011 TaxID=2029858 RepID=UPI000BAF5502|nr:N-acetylmuramic acid 6-phosphate etherase [Kocuria sp. WRN011]PBB07296.1 N-acetylmuramic acid 6-phosphate etherase [Kocuria sp. WRN011]
MSRSHIPQNDEDGAFGKGPTWLPPTERRNPLSQNLDELTTLEVLRVLHGQDLVALEAVTPVLPDLAKVVDVAAERLQGGGTIHYFGAGTSGRLGVLDASELLPTFNLEPGRVVGHIAGGPPALMSAVENAEDSVEDGRAAAANLSKDDVAIGLTASGSTPYVRGALEAARRTGAETVLIANNPLSPLSDLADHFLALDTGAEVVTGSTRLKAGTAQKLVLNAFSTSLMVAIGRTWQNLMVSVVATNQKLRDRTIRILGEAADINDASARKLLDQTDGDLKAAIVVALADVTVKNALDLLRENGQSVKGALLAAHTDGDISEGRDGS